MPGIRIQHPTERNCTFTLVDPNRRYAEPIACAVCLRTHVFKTYHLRLDESGAVIVSREIVERLKRLPGSGGFVIANEVRKPPPIVLDLSRALERPAVVAHPDLREPT